jgi:beta-lactamase regulating signal transducer with metallopeptidase domain
MSPPSAQPASPLVDRGDRGAAPATRTPGEPGPVVRLLSAPGSSGLSATSWLMATWLLVVAVEVVLIVQQRSRLARLLRRSRPLEDTALTAQLVELAGRLGLRRVPALRGAEWDGSPFVCGLLRPWLVLPEGLAGSLEPDELRQVLLHELAHVKRGDLFWDWFPTLARLLFFFHPVAHWAAGRILLERELACDQAAMSLTNQDDAGYARMLVRVASLASFPLRATVPDITQGPVEWSGSKPC